MHTSVCDGEDFIARTSETVTFVEAAAGSHAAARGEDYRRALFAATFAAGGSMLVLPLVLGFSIDHASFLPLYAVVALSAVVLPYVSLRQLDTLRPALETTSIGLLVSLPVLIFTYAAMRVGMPLADHLLARADAAMGFDWVAFIHLVDESPMASRILAAGYVSFGFQLLLLPAVLCIARMPERAYRLVLAYLVLCTLSAATGMFFPSVSAATTYGMELGSLRHVGGPLEQFLTSFHAVREQQSFCLGLMNAAGIVTFPSVHAGVAALCAWATWPSHHLRWPFVVLNLAMALGTIPFGSHYLIDVLGGFVVTTVTIPITRWIAFVCRPAQRA